MNRTTILLSFALLYAGTCCLNAKDGPRDRGTLRGLMSFNVVVDLPEPALQERGLTATAVQTEVEQQMLKAGVAVGSNAYEFVGVQIIAAHGKNTDFALCLSLGVYQAVSLKRDPAITTATPTWSSESVLLVPRRQFRQAWMETIDQLVGEFVRAWREANPPKEGTKASVAPVPRFIPPVRSARVTEHRRTA